MNHRMAVRVEGTGRTVLLLHGIPTSGALWSGVTPPLVEAGLRVIVPDLPGWGGTPPLVGPQHPAAHTAWLRDLLDTSDTSDAGPPIIVGHDLGGLLGLMLAAEKRARGVILTSAWGGLGWLGARITALPILERLFYRRYGGRLYIERGSCPTRAATALATFGPALEDPEVVPRMKAIAAGFQPRALSRLPRRVRDGGTPVACIWGTADPFIPPRLARRVAAGLDAELHWIEGARHLVPFDRPEAMAEAILGFVQRHEGHR